jgi:hypothetical protein
MASDWRDLCPAVDYGGLMKVIVNFVLDIYLEHKLIRVNTILLLTTDWPIGPNIRPLRRRSQVRFPHSTNIYVHEHFRLYWVWAFSMYSMYVFTSTYIDPLSRIHNTNLVSAYFGLDKRECECQNTN